MAINTLAMMQKMTDTLDKAIVQKAATGFFADNVLNAQFAGAKTVLIPSIAMDGLGDYDRDDGFAVGGVTVTQDTYTLSMDRGRSFQIDRMDNDETVVNLAGQVSGEFVRTKVVPEMDAYVLSTLAATATGKGHTVTVTTSSTLESDVYKMWQTALIGVQDAAGFDDKELVAFVNPTFWAALNSSSAITRQIIVSDFKQGGVTTQVKKLDGVAIIPVSSARMKSEYTFYDGTTDGQKAGGFTPTSQAKNVGLILCPKSLGGLVKKTEKVRVFTPDQYQKADAWKIDYRVYYDFFVKKSLENTVYTYTY